MQRFGKYQVVEKIGEGGFGVVWEGFDPQIRRRVAIKTCTSRDPTARKRFFREAEIAGNLHHRNVTIIYDVGQENGVPYMVQEFLTGEDLDRKIRRRDDLSFTTKLLYLLQIGRGLEYAHEQGVIHRDVKPSNIRVLDDGLVKIMDFGIARTDDGSPELTAAGQTVGTAAYLAPEQIRLSKADRRSDVHAFGVTAYELLTYERAFPGDDAMQVMQSILNREPRPVRELWPECPEPLERLVTRCCRKNPDERFAVLGELLPQLAALNEQPPGTDPKGAVLPRTPPAIEAMDSGRTQLTGDRLPPPTTLERVPLQGREARPSAQQPPPPAAKRRSVLPYLALLLFMGLVGGGAAWWYFSEGGGATLRVDGSVDASVDGSVDNVGNVGNGSGVAPATSPPLGPATDNDSEPAGDPPLAADPQYATLVVEPGWNPAIELSVSNQPAVRLDVERRFRLEPDVDHHLQFTLLTDSYEASADDSLRLRPGEERQLQAPIPRPGAITVRAALRAPQVFVRVDGTSLGWTPVRERMFAPGEHLVAVSTSSTSLTGSSQEYGVSVRSGQVLVLTFDVREGSAPTVVEKKLFQ